MGELRLKSLFVFSLFVVSLFFVSFFSVDVFAVHPLYPLFSSANSGFVFNNNSGLVSVSDTAVYKIGYFSVNGSAWQSFTLAGVSYNGDVNWLSGSSSYTLPVFGAGEHYIIVYSCTYNNSISSWDCHDGKWQLIVINNTAVIPCVDTCFSLGFDCGIKLICGSNVNCGSCSVGYNCSNNVCVVSQVVTCNGVTCASGEYCSNGVCLLDVPGDTYFIAVNGNDNNPGNFSHPWKTWQKGVLVAQPGDIVYIRGGVWQPTSHIIVDGYESANIAMLIDPIGYHQGASGTANAPIRYYNYPGEKPILDGSLVGPNAARWIGGIGIENSQYIYLKGLTIRNIHQTPPDPSHEKRYSEAYGISSNGANIRYENMVAHDIDGRAFQHWSQAWNEDDSWVDGVYYPALFDSDNTSWINCDAYNLYDRYSLAPGNAADGWKVQGYYNNYFYWEGCRAFNYSDDGFDPSGPAYRYLKNCWAMSSHKYEGLSELWAPEGNGFKMTGIGVYSVPDYFTTEKHFVRVENCIAADCMGTGFINNINVRFGEGGDWPNRGILYNNLAYKAKNGLVDVNGNGSTYKNNIVYASYGLGPTDEIFEVDTSNSWYNESHNTWIANDPTPGSWPWFYYNPDYTVTDDDFVSLDFSQLMRPRKADNSLPDITFGHLKVGSDLIDTGISVGLPFNGVAPDLGPFEYP
jgi:hypothetical protein